ncbi:hypothetical protein [Pectinatus frisingensis]|uniref:hypothetical protein n=1 Tax=Pectinatus frisingensis TaxID=865 RepID=UPI0018C852FA|nr:hypothetical protein [Pectinatus frisingensis]
MRLSDVLSNPLTNKFEQIEGFLENKKLKYGKQKKITVGKVALTYFCKHCNSDLTFCSNDELYCIGITDKLVSIDCALSCSRCGILVPVWFLIESENENFSLAPKVRILKRTEKLSERVLLKHGQYGDFSGLLEKAEQAYHDELGAGSIIYLRKILERITIQTAHAAGIATQKPNGHSKPFKEVLTKVDEQQSIIPKEFSKDGYRLFGELSDVVHGDYDERMGLHKYKVLRRLVVGVLDNVKNNREIMDAIGKLGWNEEDGEQSE